MRNKIPILVLLLVVGTGVGLAVPPDYDSQATAEIQTRLNKAHVLRHGDVQVTYQAGVATLTGTVSDLATKLQAEKAARKAPGVKQVVDNIQVQPESDQEILKHARHEVVMYYAYGIFQNVELEANNGTLTVSGQVTQPFMKTDLGRILEQVKGVADLRNELQVLPVSSFDDRLRLQIARAIYRDPYFVYYADQAIPPIHIIVDNGHVTLYGAVASKMDSIKADMDARGVGLSFSVENKLRVVKS
jgi:osmotically-inducible protein OsmY